MPRGRKRNGTSVRRTPKSTSTAAADKLTAAIKEVTQELMEEIAAEIGLEVGREMYSGQLEALGLLGNEVPTDFQIQGANKAENSNERIDIFGQKGSSLPPSCEYVQCNNCSRKFASSKYAVHLEKCMLGLTRTTSKQTTSSRSAKAKDGAGPSSSSSETCVKVEPVEEAVSSSSTVVKDISTVTTTAANRRRVKDNKGNP